MFTMISKEDGVQSHVSISERSEKYFDLDVTTSQSRSEDRVLEGSKTSSVTGDERHHKKTDCHGVDMDLFLLTNSL